MLYFLSSLVLVLTAIAHFASTEQYSDIDEALLYDRHQIQEERVLRQVSKWFQIPDAISSNVIKGCSVYMFPKLLRFDENIEVSHDIIDVCKDVSEEEMQEFADCIGVPIYDVCTNYSARFLSKIYIEALVNQDFAFDLEHMNEYLKDEPSDIGPIKQTCLINGAACIAMSAKPSCKHWDDPDCITAVAKCVSDFVQCQEHGSRDVSKEGLDALSFSILPFFCNAFANGCDKLNSSQCVDYTSCVMLGMGDIQKEEIGNFQILDVCYANPEECHSMNLKEGQSEMERMFIKKQCIAKVFSCVSPKELWDPQEYSSIIYNTGSSLVQENINCIKEGLISHFKYFTCDREKDNCEKYLHRTDVDFICSNLVSLADAFDHLPLVELNPASQDVYSQFPQCEVQFETCLTSETDMSCITSPCQEKCDKHRRQCIQQLSQCRSVVIPDFCKLSTLRDITEAMFETDGNNVQKCQLAFQGCLIESTSQECINHMCSDSCTEGRKQCLKSLSECEGHTIPDTCSHDIVHDWQSAIAEEKTHCTDDFANCMLLNSHKTCMKRPCQDICRPARSECLKTLSKCKNHSIPDMCTIMEPYRLQFDFFMNQEASNEKHCIMDFGKCMFFETPKTCIQHPCQKLCDEGRNKCLKAFSECEHKSIPDICDIRGYAGMGPTGGLSRLPQESKHCILNFGKCMFFETPKTCIEHPCQKICDEGRNTCINALSKCEHRTIPDVCKISMLSDVQLNEYIEDETKGDKHCIIQLGKCMIFDTPITCIEHPCQELCEAGRTKCLNSFTECSGKSIPDICKLESTVPLPINTQVEKKQPLFFNQLNKKAFHYSILNCLISKLPESCYSDLCQEQCTDAQNSCVEEHMDIFNFDNFNLNLCPSSKRRYLFVEEKEFNFYSPCVREYVECFEGVPYVDDSELSCLENPCEAGCTKNFEVCSKLFFQCNRLTAPTSICNSQTHKTYVEEFKSVRQAISAVKSCEHKKFQCITAMASPDCFYNLDSICVVAADVCNAALECDPNGMKTIIQEFIEDESKLAKHLLNDTMDHQLQGNTCVNVIQECASIISNDCYENVCDSKCSATIQSCLDVANVCPTGLTLPNLCYQYGHDIVQEIGKNVLPIVAELAQEDLINLQLQCVFSKIPETCFNEPSIQNCLSTNYATCISSMDLSLVPDQYIIPVMMLKNCVVMAFMKETIAERLFELNKCLEDAGTAMELQKYDNFVTKLYKMITHATQRSYHNGDLSMICDQHYDHLRETVISLEGDVHEMYTSVSEAFAQLFVCLGTDVSVDDLNNSISDNFLTSLQKLHEPKRDVVCFLHYGFCLANLNQNCHSNPCSEECREHTKVCGTMLSGCLDEVIDREICQDNDAATGRFLQAVIEETTETDESSLIQFADAMQCYMFGHINPDYSPLTKNRAEDDVDAGCQNNKIYQRIVHDSSMSNDFVDHIFNNIPASKSFCVANFFYKLNRSSACSSFCSEECSQALEKQMNILTDCTHDTTIPAVCSVLEAAGSCLDSVDQELVMKTPDFKDVMTRCAKATFAVPDKYKECVNSNLKKSDHKTLTPICLDCFTEAAVCGKQHCAFACLGCTHICLNCIDKHCFPNVLKCSGLKLHPPSC